MSQTRLAESVGLTFQQIQKYEKGTNRISASRLYQFAEILGVTIPYFFDGAGEVQPVLPKPPEEMLNLDLTRVDIAIMQTLSEIEDSRVKRKILDLIAYLAHPGGAEAGEGLTAN